MWSVVPLVGQCIHIEQDWSVSELHVITSDWDTFVELFKWYIPFSVVCGAILGALSGSWTLLVNNICDLAPIVTLPNAKIDRDLVANSPAPEPTLTESEKKAPALSSISSDQTRYNWAELDAIDQKLSTKASKRWIMNVLFIFRLNKLEHLNWCSIYNLKIFFCTVKCTIFLIESQRAWFEPD